LAIIFKSPEAFFIGLLIVPEELKPKLFPDEEHRADSAPCDVLTNDVRGSWSDFEVRKYQWDVYVRSSTTAYAYRPLMTVPFHLPSTAWSMVTDDEWNRATPVAPKEIPSEPGGSGREFVFQGKSYRPAGSHWFGGSPKESVSPDGKSLAM